MQAGDAGELLAGKRASSTQWFSLLQTQPLTSLLSLNHISYLISSFYSILYLFKTSISL
jgi:hypothetical protein